MNTLNFNANDLQEGLLFIPNVHVGNVAIQDADGQLVFVNQSAGQKNGISGIWVDLSEADMGQDVWTVNFIGVENTPQDESSSSGDLIHQYIEPASLSNAIVNTIINDYIYPQMWMFCEIQVHYEVGNRQSDGSYKFTYPNWNKAYIPQVFLNGADTQLNANNYSVDYNKGIIKPSFQTANGDNLLCSYNFSWFTPETLSSFILRSIGTINYAGQGAVSNYTISTLPQAYYGISADLVVAMCMENLILSYTMWLGKLIFSISANQMFDGSDSIVSQLETIKHNCEERAYKAIDNPQLRAPHAISRPTPAYYRSISIGNGVRLGPHGQVGYGKTRGIKYNKMVGMSGPDLDI